MRRRPSRCPIPLLQATEDGTTWRVWCPYCRREHIHGNGPGHRVAHCLNPHSPFLESGYFIALSKRRAA